MAACNCDQSYICAVHQREISERGYRQNNLDALKHLAEAVGFLVRRTMDGQASHKLADALRCIEAMEKEDANG